MRKALAGRGQFQPLVSVGEPEPHRHAEWGRAWRMSAAELHQEFKRSPEVAGLQLLRYTGWNSAAASVTVRLVKAGQEASVTARVLGTPSRR